MAHQATDKRELKDELIRGAFMLLFFVASRLVSVLVTLIALFQFLCYLIVQKPNDNVLDFGKGLSCYMAKIVLFLSYNTESKPWPFSPWADMRPPDTELTEESDNSDSS